MIYLKIILLSVLLLLFSGISTLYAQRGHIVLFDTLHTNGYMQDILIEDNTVLFYKRFPEDKFTKFTIDQVSEFSHKNRYFYRREIVHEGVLRKVFLERIISSKTAVTLYRLNGSDARFYIEADSALHRLDHKVQLKEAFPNPDLEYLIAKTKIKESQLKYLFKTASEINFKPRTFTNLLVFTPYAGVGNVSHTFKVFVTNDDISLSTWSPFLGLNVEAFLNFKRNLSLNFSPQLFSFQNKFFFTTTSAKGEIEADIYLSYLARQSPLSVKYYFDAKPQKLRLYGEFGYVYSKINLRRTVSHQATITGNEVRMTSEEFSIPDRHSGFMIGIGAERYFFGHKGVVLSLKYSKMAESLESSMEQVQFSSGFKF